MLIIFRTRKLEKSYLHFRTASQNFGHKVAEAYIARIDAIKAATDIKMVKILPVLRCHPLTGDRRGQWAASLTVRMRLIFTLQGKKLEIVCIEEVSKHYGD